MTTVRSGRGPYGSRFKSQDHAVGFGSRVCQTCRHDNVFTPKHAPAECTMCGTKLWPSGRNSLIPKHAEKSKKT